MLRFTSSLAAGLLLSAVSFAPGYCQPAEEKPAGAAEPAKPAEAAQPALPPAAEPSSGAGSASTPAASPTTPGAIPLPEIRVTIPDEPPAAPKRAAKPRVASPGGVAVRPEPVAPSRARTTAAG